MTVPSRATQVAAAIRTVRDTMPSILARYAELLERVAIEVEKLGGETFQPRCQAWLNKVTEGDPTDTEERIARFVEESLELAQSLGLERNAAMQLVHYVFDRPPGEPAQEFGGVATTLAVLAEHTGHDLLTCGEAELARVWDPAVIEKIRGKRSRRHGRGPLPGTTEGDLVPRDAARFAQLAPEGRAPIPEGYSAELKPPYDPVRGWMAPGCCSASSPCSHQKRDPHSICETCQKAALVDPEEVGRDEVLEAALHAHQHGEEE